MHDDQQKRFLEAPLLRQAEGELKNEQSASVIGQRPNFIIAYYSASADCEKCSFGHCLTSSNLNIDCLCSKMLKSWVISFTF